jgi:hypothetical protein
MSRESKKVRKERRARNKTRKAELLQPSNLPIDKEHARARFGHMRGRGFAYQAVALMGGLVAATPGELNQEIGAELIRRTEGEPEN